MLNVSNCMLLGNGATNGGGINNNGGTLNVTNCTFTGNVANSNGGGISNDIIGTVNVSNSTFSGNIGNNGDLNADGGGAICNGNTNNSHAGILNVTNCTLSGNIAFHGGGISSRLPEYNQCDQQYHSAETFPAAASAAAFLATPPARCMSRVASLR